MEEIKYNLVFSRRRSISIVVNPDKTVTVRAPLKASLKTIEKFVQAKASWIRKHLNNKSGIRLMDTRKKYTDGELHLYLGKEYALRKIMSAVSFVRVIDDAIEVGQKDINDSFSTKALLERWYVQTARELLAERFKEITEKYGNYGFSPVRLAVRSLKSRWGSCTLKGKITLNSELIKLDQALIDYVIIHELCHLKYHNHGKDYYWLLGELVPEYKSMRKELRKYITH
jgi:predicted metal-dependent hydrolase